MLNAFRHLTPSFIAYRGVKPGWKFWWRRDSRTIFSSQNQIESLSRPGLLCPISLEKVQVDEAFEVYDDTRCHTFVILRTAVSDGKACSSLRV